MSLPATRARRGRAAFAAAILVAGLLVAACGSDGEPGAKGASTTAVASGMSVMIDTFIFLPKTLHVRAGDTGTWTNRDNILHTVSSGTRDYEPGDSGHVTATHKDGGFDMQLDGKGATGKHTFTKTGTFHYFCDRHPGMEADIEVS